MCQNTSEQFLAWSVMLTVHEEDIIFVSVYIACIYLVLHDVNSIGEDN